jgi:hypothetical protein
MRRLLELLVCCLFVLTCSAALGQLTVLEYDNFAPPLDVDLELIESALSVVPAAGSCDRRSCPKYSCSAMSRLHVALGRTAGTLEKILEATRLATNDYKQLLDRFEADYQRLKMTDELLELGKRWSKFSLAAGKALLDTASLLSGAQALDTLTDLMENATLDAVQRGLLLWDTLFEAHSSVISLIDGLGSLTGSKPVFSDIANKLFTLKSAMSDIMSAMDAYSRALKAYSGALERGLDHEIRAARGNLRGLRPTWGSAGQIVGKILAAYAEVGIAEITDRLAQNARDEEQDNLAFALNYGRYVRLMDRQVRLAMLLARVTTALQTIVPCAARCPEWAGHVPTPKTQGTTFGSILKELNPTLMTFPGAIREAAGALQLDGMQPPVLAAVPAVTAPEQRAEARYNLAACIETQGAQLRLVYPGFTFRNLGAASPGTQMRMSFRAPIDPDIYELEIRDSHGALLAKAPFTVEKLLPEEETGCGGVTLAKGMASPTMRQHLIGKSFDFAFGTPGETNYLAGRITVTPRIACPGGTHIAFPVFGGVSREAEYFKVEVTAGDRNSVTYVEQWITEMTVGFDNGTSGSTWNTIGGVEVPAGAKRVDYLRMHVQRGSNDLELVWGTP